MLNLDKIDYIDSNFDDGLNLLNYKCNLKCYLFKVGNECSNLTGGWSGKDYYNSGSTLAIISTSTSTRYISTVNTINTTGYSSLSFTVTSYDYSFKCGITTSKGNHNSYATSTRPYSAGTTTASISSYQSSYYVQISNADPVTGYVSSVWLTP